MLLEEQRQAIRLLLTKNSSFDLCKSNIDTYRQNALAVNAEDHAAYADYYDCQIHINKGSNLKAQQLIQGIIPYFIKSKNDNFLQASYLVLGVIKHDLDNAEESLYYFDKATTIQTSMKQNKAVAYNNLTRILIEFKQYDKAIKKLNEALKIVSLKDTLDRPLYYNVLLNLSRVFLLKNNPEKSFEILEKVKNAQKKYPQDRIEAKLNGNYATYYVYKKEYDKAIHHLDLGIDYCVKFNFKPILLNLTVKKAEVLIEINKLDEAEKILLKEYEDYKMENALSYKDIINCLIEIYMVKGNDSERKRYEEELEIISNR